MAQNITCLVTIHGIGFQHAPDGGEGGYADGLQTHLQPSLHTLAGDPVAEFGRPAGTGAIYVHSDWPPGSGRMNEGLKRLGTWKQDDPGHRSVEVSDAPLASGDNAVAHVALVYAGLEERQPHLGAALETLAKAMVTHDKYVNLPSFIKTGFADMMAMLHPGAQTPAAPTPSLQPRRAVAAPARTTPASGQADAHSSSDGAMQVLETLDEDISTYVVRNDLRERVRGFVHDALLRICLRDDVSHVVVNAHSQGTVLAFDVVRELPPVAFAKVAHFVTAGSPLRKYVDLFYWGNDAGCLSQIPWTNFWDPTDPVADPLIPPASWQPGQALPTPPPDSSQLYTAVDADTGVRLPVRIRDVEVANAAHGAGGGLPAHNYWDNNEEFVATLADILQKVATKG